jgi:hypothetical protein
MIISRVVAMFRVPEQPLYFGDIGYRELLYPQSVNLVLRL